jgi:hypothetical protein
LNRVMDEPGTAIRMVDMMAEGKSRTAESERQFEKLKAERDDKMKWSYGPASILAVLGLILLVSPQSKS